MGRHRGRHIATWIALMAGALGLAACGPIPPMEITIVSEDWNGWDPEHKTTPHTVTMKAEAGAQAQVDNLGADKLIVRVITVSADAVEIQLSEPMAPASEAGGVNLSELQDRFEVRSGRTTRFATASMDAGISYEVTLRVN